MDNIWRLNMMANCQREDQLARVEQERLIREISAGQTKEKAERPAASSLLEWLSATLSGNRVSQSLR